MSPSLAAIRSKRWEQQNPRKETDLTRHLRTLPIRWLALLVAAGSSFIPAFAQPVPLEDPVRVNQTVAGSQHEPAVARSADGTFVVVWVDNSAPVPTIALRRFASDGSPLGPETPVFQPPSDWCHSPSVAVVASGNAFVTWLWYDATLPGYRVYGRAYDSSGVALTPPFQVSDSVGDSENSTRVTATAAGIFVAAWEAYVSGSGTATWARPFDASGNALAPAFEIAPEAGTSYEPALAPSGADLVATAYVAYQPGSSTETVEVRRFAPDGSWLGSPFVVAEDEGYGVFVPAIQSGDRDDFVVAWGLETGFPYSTIPMVEVVGADGTPRGGPVVLGGETYSAIGLARTDDGTFVAVWESLYGSDVRAFGPTADPVGATLVLGDPDHGSAQPDLALDSAGNPVFVFTAWTDDTDEADVYAQRFRSASLLIDGFESGDTSAWSATQP
jgi:hypothetical protein